MENFCLADELAKQKVTLADINEFLTTELKARSLAAAQARCSGSSRSSRRAHACMQTRQQSGVAQPIPQPRWCVDKPFVC